MKAIIIAVSVYLFMAWLTFGYASKQEFERLRADGRAAYVCKDTATIDGAFKGILWPLYIPMRVAVKMWGVE